MQIQSKFLKQKNYNLEAEKKQNKIYTEFGDINYAKACADTINKHFCPAKEETSINNNNNKSGKYPW